MAKFRTVDLLGTGVHALSMEEVLNLCDESIIAKDLLLLGVVNVAKVVNCRKNADLRKSLDETDIILADGVPIVWLSKLIGNPLPERVDALLQLL